MVDMCHTCSLIDHPIVTIAEHMCLGLSSDVLRDFCAFTLTRITICPVDCSVGSTVFWRT